MAVPKNTIVVLGLEKDAHKLRNKGLSVREIAKHLTETAETPVSHSAVQRYFDLFKEKPEVRELSITLPTKAAQVAVEILEEKITTVQEVDAVIKKLEEIMNRSSEENTRDDSMFIKAAKEAVRYYDLKAKLTGDINPSKANAAQQNNVVIYIPDNGRD